MSDETSMPPMAHQCESCKKAAEAAAASEDTNFAFLLALVPVLALTFFGNIGLL